MKKTAPEIRDVFYVDVHKYADPPVPPELEKATVKITEKLFVVTSRNWWGQSHYTRRDDDRAPGGFSWTPREAWERFAGGKEAEISGLLDSLEEARAHLAVAKEKLKEWKEVEEP